MIVSKFSRLLTLERQIFHVFLLFALFISTQAFSFTNTYSDFYGINYFQPSNVVNQITQLTGKSIFLPDYLVFTYTFEMNKNPKMPGILEQGFTLKSNLSSLSPLLKLQEDTLRYTVIGASYDLGAKLYGKLESETVYGLGVSICVDAESVHLFVGSSSDINSFKNNEFKHFNSVSNVNVYTLLKLFAQFPIQKDNYFSKYLSYIVISAGYYLGATVFGPFLPDFTPAGGEWNKSMNGIALSVQFGNAY